MLRARPRAQVRVFAVARWRMQLGGSPVCTLYSGGRGGVPCMMRPGRADVPGVFGSGRGKVRVPLRRSRGTRDRHLVRCAARVLRGVQQFENATPHAQPHRSTFSPRHQAIAAHAATQRAARTRQPSQLKASRRASEEQTTTGRAKKNLAASTTRHARLNCAAERCTPPKTTALSNAPAAHCTTTARLPPPLRPQTAAPARPQPNPHTAQSRPWAHARLVHSCSACLQLGLLA
jgi:hypothetical protein